MARVDPIARREYNREYQRRRRSEDPEYKEKCAKRDSEAFKKRYREDERFREKRAIDHKKWVEECGGRDKIRESQGYIPWEEYLAKMEAQRKAKASYMREWGKTEAGRRARVTRSIKKHGVAIEQYDEAYSNQEGKCCICGVFREKYASNRLVVDHCHHSGKFRALLCNKCNSAIGMLGEDEQTLLNAIDYLNSVRGSPE